jgi:hypothetical protein
MMLSLQMLYVALGVGANLLSWAHRLRTGRTLTPVDPRGGLLTMTLYAACAALRHYQVPGANAALVAMLLLIAYGGVYRHLRGNANEYASAASRWSAIAINSFGVLATTATLAT